MPGATCLVRGAGLPRRSAASWLTPYGARLTAHGSRVTAYGLRPDWLMASGRRPRFAIIDGAGTPPNEPCGAAGNRCRQTRRRATSSRRRAFGGAPAPAAGVGCLGGAPAPAAGVGCLGGAPAAVDGGFCGGEPSRQPPTRIRKTSEAADVCPGCGAGSSGDVADPSVRRRRLTAHGSRLTAYGSRLGAHSLRLMADGSRLTAHGDALPPPQPALLKVSTTFGPRHPHHARPSVAFPIVLPATAPLPAAAAKCPNPGDRVCWRCSGGSFVLRQAQDERRWPVFRQAQDERKRLSRD